MDNPSPVGLSSVAVALSFAATDVKLQPQGCSGWQSKKKSQSRRERPPGIVPIKRGFSATFNYVKEPFSPNTMSANI